MKQVNIAKHSRKSKAPYTKSERLERRREVARLHIDLGYPCTEIANLMKRDPHTIYKDIKAIYKQLSKEHQGQDLNDWFIKQLTRLEKQRGQLIQLLDKQTDFEKILSTQRLILEIVCGSLFIKFAISVHG